MYFITVFEHVKEWPHTGDQRTWGYYHRFMEAQKAVENNLTDMREGCYDYALIERIEPGICAHSEQMQWYMWDSENGRYTEIDQPESMKRLCNFALG